MDWILALNRGLDVGEEVAAFASRYLEDRAHEHGQVGLLDGEQPVSGLYLPVSNQVVEYAWSLCSMPTIPEVMLFPVEWFPHLNEVEVATLVRYDVENLGRCDGIEV